jgi:OmpA family
MKNYCFLFLLLYPLSTSILLGQNALSQTIFFETKQTTLSEEAKTQLTTWIQTFSKQDITKITVTGFADAVGTDVLNQNLSEQRAATVMAFLVAKGLDYQQILAVGRGKTGTEEEKNQSRRVDILVELNAKSPPSVPTNSVSKANPSTPFEKDKPHHIMRLYQQLAVKIQDFKVNTQRDTILKGERGTRLYVPKGAFAGIADNAIVDFKLKECYDFSDMISENLTTMHGDKLLRTGGMIYTEAFANGKKLDLKRPIKVEFSSKESKEEGMQLFVGNRDAKRNGAMDWTPLSNSEVLMAKPDNNFTDNHKATRLPNTGLSTTIYGREGGAFVPYLVLDDTRKRPLNLQEICDLSKCPTLLNDRNAIKTDEIRKVDVWKGQSSTQKIDKTSDSQTIQEVSNNCGALMLYAQDHPQDQNLTLAQIHRKAFDDAYILYGVNTLEELKQQPSKSWDSLMVIRKDVMLAYERGLIKTEENRVRIEAFNKEWEKKNEEMRKKWEEENKEWLAFESKFEMPKLGWFNCDAYYNENKMVQVQTNLNSTNQSDLKVVMKNSKQLIASYGNGIGQKITASVPLNERVILVGMKIENGQTYLALHEMKGANTTLNLNFIALSPAEIKEKLKILN